MRTVMRTVGLLKKVAGTLHAIDQPFDRSASTTSARSS
jgi:hypothetical protein